VLVRRPAFTLEQLRSFAAVADAEHISRAAASLFLTQGAVTQQVRHFERALGLQLLERDGRRIRLTDAGRSMAVACRAALRAMEVVEDTAHSMRAVTMGSLHVGASPTCGSYYMPRLLAEFAKQHPRIKLELTVDRTQDICGLVIAGTLDCGVVEGDPDPELLSVALATDELIMVAHSGHPLASLDRVTPADLAKHRFLRRGSAWGAEKNIRQMLGDAYDQVETMSLGHQEYVRAAAVAGLGFAALPKQAVAAELASGVLVQLPTQTMVRQIRAVRRRAHGGPALEEFWQLVQNEATARSETIYADGSVSA
jgi:DNA-binding transcriptional LysR family regulator